MCCPGRHLVGIELIIDFEVLLDSTDHTWICLWILEHTRPQNAWIKSKFWGNYNFCSDNNQISPGAKHLNGPEYS